MLILRTYPFMNLSALARTHLKITDLCWFFKKNCIMVLKLNAFLRKVCLYETIKPDLNKKCLTILVCFRCGVIRRLMIRGLWVRLSPQAASHQENHWTNSAPTGFVRSFKIPKFLVESLNSIKFENIFVLQMPCACKYSIGP